MVAYCPSCGGELTADAAFCSSCGAGVDTSDNATSGTEADATEDADAGNSRRRYLPSSWRVGFASVVFGLVIGLLIAWALLQIGGSGTGFFLGFAGATLYLWQKQTATGVVGSGLYISALLLILVPVLFYGGMIATVDDPQTAEETGAAIGSIVGLVVWGFAFALVAVVVGALGYFFKRRERKKLAAQPHSKM